MEPHQAAGPRRLPIWGYLVLVAAYLAAIQTIPRLIAPASTAYAKFESLALVTGGLWVMAGVGSVFVVAGLFVWRMWRPALRERSRLPAWVWVFPAVMVAAAVIGAGYGQLADRGVGFTLALLVGTLGVGFSEEGMFRGIGVVTFRQAGLSEAKVALWTSVIFGAAHATNIVSEGAGAIPQAVLTAVAGYFFYLTRRVSGRLVVAMLVHGLWDFALLSRGLSDTLSPLTGVFVAAIVILAITAATTYRRLFPRLPVS